MKHSDVNKVEMFVMCQMWEEFVSKYTRVERVQILQRVVCVVVASEK